MDADQPARQEEMTKLGAKVASHGLHGAFQMAGVAIPRPFFAGIQRPIAELRPPARYHRL